MMANLLLIILTTILSGSFSEKEKLRITIRPDQGHLITAEIQRAIDSCASAGGGTVHFPKGKFLTGGIRLKSNLTISLAPGATIQGSDNYKDYGEGKRPDPMFSGDSLTNVSFIGKGVIDGQDCTSPTGEEGFRGPHCIKIFNSKNLSFKGITILHSGNYAIFSNYSDGISLKDVTILGGHDGLHTRFSKNITAEDCDFRTGDDAFAGNDNVNYVVKRCSVNTSCNGFRLGGQGVLIEDCRIWGPGQYKHIKQNRNNTLSAFIHFSPQDANPKLESSGWLVKNVTVENVDNVYIYDYAGGLWQTGQPMTDIRFDNLRVKDVKKGFTVIGDPNRRFSLTISNSVFINTKNDPEIPPFKTERTAIDTRYLLTVQSFDKVSLNNVTFKNFPSEPLVGMENGNEAMLTGVKILPKRNQNPVATNNITNVIYK